MQHNRYTLSEPAMQVDIRLNIGIDENARQSVVEMLNVILADEAVLAIKTRNAHWNIRGADFLGLHNLFDAQYRQLDDICDEVAERARMLGGFAMGSFPDFSKHTRLDEQPSDVPDILRLLADQEAIIRGLRGDAAKCTEEYEDEGTFDLLVSLIRLHEKMAWMLRSYTELDQTEVEFRNT